MSTSTPTTDPTLDIPLSERKLSDLTDAEIRALTEEQAATTGYNPNAPLIGPLEPLESVKDEYRNAGAEVFLRKLEGLEKMGFTKVRRTRGDGDCFYRSFIWSYLERLVDLPGEESKKAFYLVESLLPTLEAVGFEKEIFEDFYAPLQKILKNLASPAVTGRRPSHEELYEALTRDEDAMCTIVFLRLLTSAYLKTHPDEFVPFLFAMEDDPRWFGNAPSMDDFCGFYVEPCSKEADHLQITALTRALGVHTRIAYLDQSSPAAKFGGGVGEAGTEVDFHEFEEEEQEKLANVLLYRPGHYDSGGYKQVGLPAGQYTVGGPQRDKEAERDLELGDLGADVFYDESEAPDVPSSFASNVSSIRELLKGFEASIQTLNTRQMYSLSQPSDELTSQIDVLTAQLQLDSSDLTKRIGVLGTQVGRDEARRGHWETLKGGLGRAVGRWQQVESQQRQRIRERVARQYKIVKPEATELEIKEVLESNQGDQIFDQAVAGSREAGAQAALSEAQTRRAEMAKLEATITELALLMTQVSELVATQDQQFITIEETTATVEKDTLDGVNQLTTAKVSAAAARHKRKICAGFFGLILLILYITAMPQGIFADVPEPSPEAMREALSLLGFETDKFDADTQNWLPDAVEKLADAFVLRLAAKARAQEAAERREREASNQPQERRVPHAQPAIAAYEGVPAPEATSGYFASDPARPVRGLPGAPKLSPPPGIPLRQPAPPPKTMHQRLLLDLLVDEKRRAEQRGERAVMKFVEGPEPGKESGRLLCWKGAPTGPKSKDEVTLICKTLRSTLTEPAVFMMDFECKMHEHEFNKKLGNIFKLADDVIELLTVANAAKVMVGPAPPPAVSGSKRRERESETSEDTSSKRSRDDSGYATSSSSCSSPPPAAASPESPNEAKIRTWNLELNQACSIATSKKPYNALVFDGTCSGFGDSYFTAVQPKDSYTSRGLDRPAEQVFFSATPEQDQSLWGVEVPSHAHPLVVGFAGVAGFDGLLAWDQQYDVRVSYDRKDAKRIYLTDIRRCKKRETEGWYPGFQVVTAVYEQLALPGGGAPRYAPLDQQHQRRGARKIEQLRAYHRGELERKSAEASKA
ncbi:syntaxin [Pseudohyphozyma bogoriensis]|nr:syntaxin [Pseudohyphozyma bogoriensis]